MNKSNKKSTFIQLNLCYNFKYSFALTMQQQYQSLDKFQEMSLEQLIHQIKRKKTVIIDQQKTLKNNLTKYHQQLAISLQTMESKKTKKLQQNLLSYLELQNQISSKLHQLQKNHEKLQYGKDMNDVHKLMNWNLVELVGLPLDRVEQVFERFYDIDLRKGEERKEEEDEERELIEELEEVLFVTEGDSFGKVGNEEFIIGKLEDKIERMMLKQEQMIERIRSLESTSARKYSKQSLKQKPESQTYSTITLDRYKQQSKILKNQLLESDQTISTLLSEVSELRKQLNNNDNTNGSILQTQLKSLNMLDNKSCLIEGRSISQRDQRDIYMLELQGRNEELVREVQRLMIFVRELEDRGREMDQQLALAVEEGYLKNHQIMESKNQNQIMIQQIERLVSEKGELSCQLNLEKSNSQEQIKKLQTSNIALSIRLQQLQLQNIKLQKTYTTQLQIQKSTNQELLEKKNQLQQANNKIQSQTQKSKQEQQNWKSYLNTQIANQKREMINLSETITNNQNIIYDLQQKNRCLENYEKISNEKMEALKVENIKLKKKVKEGNISVNQMKQQMDEIKVVQNRLQYLQERVCFLSDQFMKFKENVEKKQLIGESKYQLLKEKFTSQLNNLLANQAASTKTSKNKIDIVQKYIESLSISSGKNAQIKQLKEELKDIKQSKETKKIIKKLKIEQKLPSIEADVFNLNAKIIEERYKSQKMILEERVKEYEELKEKQQEAIELLERELEREKGVLLEYKNQQKSQQCKKDQANRVQKLKTKHHQKTQRLETEVKTIKSILKKTQNEYSDSQTEDKNKRMIIANQKKQLKDKNDAIKKLEEEIASYQYEEDKWERYGKQIAKKQMLCKQIKEKYLVIEEENSGLKSRIESLQKEMRLANKQIQKKDESIKELKFIEDKKTTKKEEQKYHELNHLLISQKQTIRKLRSQIDRKDQLLKNNKSKFDNKMKQNQENLTKTQKEREKNQNELDVLEKKYDNLKVISKKEESKSCLLKTVIKKIYEVCSEKQMKIHIDEYPTIQTNKGHKRQSTDLYSNFSLKNSALTMNKGLENLEGLQILNITKEDLFKLQNQSSVYPLSVSPNKMKSTTFNSPEVPRKSIVKNQQALMAGIESLDRILQKKQVQISQILQIFKQA